MVRSIHRLYVCFVHSFVCLPVGSFVWKLFLLICFFISLSIKFVHSFNRLSIYTFSVCLLVGSYDLLIHSFLHWFVCFHFSSVPFLVHTICLFIRFFVCSYDLPVHLLVRTICLCICSFFGSSILGPIPCVWHLKNAKFPPYRQQGTFHLFYYLEYYPLNTL